MPTYKFYYFPFKGAGEGVRLILKAGGIDFEDCGLAGEEWGKMKASMPFGQMPVLEVDGKKLSQGAAIAAYAGEIGGLLPATPCERAKALEMTVAWADLSPKFALLMAQKENKAEMKKIYEETMSGFIKPRLGVYDAHLKASPSGYITSKLSYADLFTYNNLKGLEHFFGANLADYPALKAFVAKIEAEPCVKDYIASRKDVPFAPMSFAQMIQ